MISPGWHFDPGNPAKTVLPVGQRPVSCAEISAVLVRVDRIVPGDIPLIHLEDRAYVAQEVTALLLAWLRTLCVPVTNRPTPRSLGGPGWSANRWRACAARLSVPLADWDVRPGGIQTALVVGGTCLCDNEFLRDSAVKLAREAAVDLLEVRYDDAGRFVHASAFPDLSQPERADTVLRYLDASRKDVS
jgi:hypothetical protein